MERNWTENYTFANPSSTLRPTVAEILGSEERIVIRRIFQIASIISALSFYLTTAFIATIWREQSTGTKFQCIHFLQRGIYFTFLNGLEIVEKYFQHISILCSFVAALDLLITMMSCIWVNCMTYFMWSRLRFKKGVSVASRKRQNSSALLNRPLKQAIFISATGGISIMVFAVTMDIIYKGIEKDAPFSPPGFGVEACTFFATEEAALIYMFGPIGVLSVVNIVIFIMTLVSIKSQERSIGSQFEFNKTGWKTYMRLLVLFELTWTVGFLVWAFYAYLYQLNRIVDIICLVVLYPVDFITTLNGLFCFFMVAWPNRAKIFETIKGRVQTQSNESCQTSL